MASYVISREVARKAATELIKKKFEEVENELTQREYVFSEKLARKYYPKKVLDLVAEYPNYLGFTTYFYVRHDCMTNRRLDTEVKIPVAMTTIKVDAYEYSEAEKIRKAWKKISDEKENIKQRIIDDILRLRTYNRVKELVPELLPFLPEPKDEKQLPAADFDYFRECIKQVLK